MSPKEVFRIVPLLFLSLVLRTGSAYAADHQDSPLVRNDPTTDLGDVMAWMSPDATRLNLIATVVRQATTESRFSDAARYVFHTRSTTAFGADEGREVNIVCTFEGTTQQIVTCDAGGVTSVTGDASTPEGIASQDGLLRVFAGLRNDAFFFNSEGFNAVRRAVIDASSSLTFDPAGCPALDGDTASALQTQLRSSEQGGPAPDNFGNANILVIAISVDKTLVTPAGPVVAVWGSTHRR